MEELEKIKQLLYKKLENVDYEERSPYGVIDAIEETFEETQQQVKNNDCIADVGFSLPSKEGIQKRTEEYEKDNFRGKLIEGYAGKDFKAGIDYILDFISN